MLLNDFLKTVENEFYLMNLDNDCYITEMENHKAITRKYTKEEWSSLNFKLHIRLPDVVHVNHIA